MMKYLFLLSILYSTTEIIGQERNFEVDPSMATCDTLPDSFSSLDEALRMIPTVKYRIEQNFNIRRKKGLKSGKFYSCNNETGYVILEIDESRQVYEKVSLIDWEDLISSNDPEMVISSIFDNKYHKITR